MIFNKNYNITLEGTIGQKSDMSICCHLVYEVNNNCKNTFLNWKVFLSLLKLLMHTKGSKKCITAFRSTGFCDNPFLFVLMDETQYIKTSKNF